VDGSKAHAASDAAVVGKHKQAHQKKEDGWGKLSQGKKYGRAGEFCADGEVIGRLDHGPTHALEKTNHQK